MTHPTDRRATALVNGEPYPLPAPTTVAALVAALLPELTAPGAQDRAEGADHAAPSVGVTQGVAVAIDDVVLARSAWASTTLRDGDRVEVVTAVQGG